MAVFCDIEQACCNISADSHVLIAPMYTAWLFCCDTELTLVMTLHLYTALRCAFLHVINWGVILHNNFGQ
jgi:hypothetical protein